MKKEGITCFTSVQSLSHVRLFATPWTTAHHASLSVIDSRSLPKLISIESMMPSIHLILCRLLLLLPSIFPSIRVFSNESVFHIKWPKYWSFSFNISPSNEYAGLFSFRMDWLDLLAVQGTLKSLLQHHSSKASILWCSAFFIVQLSHPYMTTGKTIALTRRTFVDKVMSLLFNMLSRFKGQKHEGQQGWDRVSEVVSKSKRWGRASGSLNEKVVIMCRWVIQSDLCFSNRIPLDAELKDPK